MEEDSEEIKISYETLFELVRRERSREELQKLPPSFFDNVSNYLKEKNNLLKEKESQLDFAEEKLKTKKEIENIKKILIDLHNRRERKIINLAIDKSITKSSIIDAQLLQKEEKVLFDRLVNLLDENRKILLDLFLESTKKEDTSNTGTQEEKKVEEKEANQTVNSEVPETQSKTSEQAGSPVSDAKKDTKLVRFLHAVPKFMGLEGEEYGPFEEEDVASLPSEITDLLLKKERVEEIKES